MAAAEGSNKDDQFFKTPVPEVQIQSQIEK